MGDPDVLSSATRALTRRGGNRAHADPSDAHSSAARFGSDLLGESRQPRNPISQRQIETVVSRSAAGIGLVFALQTLPIMLPQMDVLKPGWGLLLAIALYGGVALVVFATVFKKGIRPSMGFVAAAFLVAVIAWPFLVLDPGAVLEGKPWLWYFCTVATSCAAIAMPLAWAAVYTVVAPAAYGVIRWLPAGGNADALLASLDVVYAVLLGQVVLIIIYMLRQATAAVDVAQINALHKYGIAVRQHATEVERVQVDAIVHDTVLATLLSAASARGPQETALAAGMARDAIARLNDAGMAPVIDETVVPFARLGDRIRRAAAALACPFTVVQDDIQGLTIPLHVSESLYSAAVQAMVNSLQHAGVDPAVTRSLTMTANLQGGCTIKLSDNGVGFDPAEVPSERLGLRVSIQERVISAGGVVTVRTSVGHGTTIVLEWPRPDSLPDPVVSQFTPEEIPVLGLDDGARAEGGTAT
ncbi:MAG: two-component system sensor protein [Cryobacterium sp.]|nr:two-component system sensor protein [Cryobacterium sp.]